MGGLLSKTPVEERDQLEIDISALLNTVIINIEFIHLFPLSVELKQKRVCQQIVSDFRGAFLNKEWALVHHIHTYSFPKLFSKISRFQYEHKIANVIEHDLKQISEKLLRYFQVVGEINNSIANAAQVQPKVVPSAPPKLST